MFVRRVFVCVLMCRRGGADVPRQTDGYLVDSSGRVLLYRRAKRLSCNLHCLPLLSPPTAQSLYLSSSLCVCAFVRLLIYSLCSPSACVNISTRDKGTEGACWLVFVSVLEADTGGNKWHAGSCPAQSLHWVPSLMAILRQ